jgi:hypothetical protein
MSKWTERTLKISPEYDEQERQAIADDVIEYITKRTKEGKGEGNTKFDNNKYSPEYTKSIDFKLKPNPSPNRVDLFLTGDMLTAIELIEEDEGKIKYGVPDDSPENGKAEGNIRGTYGKSSPNKSKARDFLTISKKELDKILSRYPLEKQKAKERALFLNIIRNKVAGLDLNGEG